MQRVCGATEERDALSRSRCWCRGVFCGRGGHALSRRFWREIHKHTICYSRDQFEDAIRQLDLFSGNALAETWRARVPERPHLVKRGAPRKDTHADVF